MAQQLTLEGTVTLTAAASTEGGQLDGTIILKLKDNLALGIGESCYSRRTLDSEDFAAIDLGPVDNGAFLVAVTDGGAAKLKVNGGSEILYVDGLLVWQPPTSNPITAISAAALAAGTPADLELLVIEISS